MVTRITSSAVASSLAGRINSSYANYAKISQQMGSGYKINSLMDDPVQSINIVNSTRKMNQIGTWTNNVQALNNEIKESSEVIDYAITKSQRAKDLATTAASGTTTKDQLKATLVELDSIINTIVDRANTNYNGNYIYSGANTTTPAYEIQYAKDAAGNDTSDIIGIKYNGTPITDDWQRRLEIADGLFQHCNLTGIEVFGEYEMKPVLDANDDPVVDANGNPTYQLVNGKSSGIMQQLIEFRNGLKNTISLLEQQENLPDNTPDADRQLLANSISNSYDAFNSLLDDFSASMQKMTTANVKFGSITNKLDMSEDSLKDSENNLKEFISDIRDVDVMQAVTEWYNAQYAYQASMQASLSAMQYNLLNYLS